MKPIIVRGGGDLATGTIHRLCQSGYPVIILEDTKPSAIRQKVSFCQAVYEGTMEVEGIVCTKVDSFQEAMEKEQKISYVSRFQRLDGTYFWAAGIIEKMLDGIDVRLNCDYFKNKEELDGLANKILLLTGGRNNGLIGIIEGKKGVKIQFSGRKYSSL